MCHTYMSHGTHMNESGHTGEGVTWVMCKIQMSYGTHMNESGVMAHIWTSRDPDGLNLGIHIFVYVYKVHLCIYMLRSGMRSWTNCFFLLTCLFFWEKQKMWRQSDEFAFEIQRESNPRGANLSNLIRSSTFITRPTCDGNIRFQSYIHGWSSGEVRRPYEIWEVCSARVRFPPYLKCKIHHEASLRGSIYLSM